MYGFPIFCVGCYKPEYDWLGSSFVTMVNNPMTDSSIDSLNLNNKIINDQWKITSYVTYFRHFLFQSLELHRKNPVSLWFSGPVADHTFFYNLWTSAVYVLKVLFTTFWWRNMILPLCRMYKLALVLNITFGEDRSIPFCALKAGYQKLL